MKILLFALVLSTSIWCQGPGNNIVSPEVHPDRRVTFRVQAPKATEVTFFGDWMETNKSEKMTKGDGGVWSVTLGPLPPSVYIYSFTVDGMTIADPINPRMKLRARTSASLLEVPPEPGAVWQPGNVPHGAVEINWQKSAVLGGETRSFWVYTPPGYEKDRGKRYPVLYLFHGSNDTAGGWTLVGHANFVLDNLIAAKKASEMIVVMPFGHAVPFGSPREQQAKNVPLYEEYIIKEIIPFVEGKYRVAPGREKRAIAGLSMGGGQSLAIGFAHPDLFSSIAAFSSAIPNDFENRFAAVLSDPKKTNAQMKNIWVACGRQDPAFSRSEKFSELLTAKQIKHTWVPTEGNHTYTYWRQYLAEFVPLLFH